jgi:CO/xanthine dehydrogenase FAD-binding subunit
MLAAGDGEIIPIAGGTDLMVHWPGHLAAHDRTYLDLSHLEELKPLRWNEDELVLGALTTYWQVIQDPTAKAEFPLLEQAARQVGAIQIQARGTWAGNIANASPAADGVPVLMAYDARLELVSAEGSEEIALADFYLGYKKTRRRPDQLIRSIRIPRRAYSLQIFEKVGSRRAQAISKLGFALTRSAASHRVVANSVAPFVCRCPALEDYLDAGKSPSQPEDLLPALNQDIAPIDDIRSTAAYRKTVLSRILFHALKPMSP